MLATVVHKEEETVVTSTVKENSDPMIRIMGIAVIHMSETEAVFEEIIAAEAEIVRIRTNTVSMQYSQLSIIRTARDRTFSWDYREFRIIESFLKHAGFGRDRSSCPKYREFRIIELRNRES